MAQVLALPIELQDMIERGETANSTDEVGRSRQRDNRILDSDF